MNALALQSFGFEGQTVRVMDHAGCPWFVAQDVCACLEIVNHRNVVSALDDDEKGVHTMDTLGGAQQVTIISESGLYALIFKSRKPAAVRFRKWVTADVLPTLRQTGRFEIAPSNDDDAADSFDALRLGLQVVREARIVFGRAAGRRAWRLMQMPDVTAGLSDAIEADLERADLPESIADWMQARTDAAPGHRIQCRQLYTDYAEWCRSQGLSGGQVESETRFGRVMKQCGIGVSRGPNCNYRVGLRLKD